MRRNLEKVASGSNHLTQIVPAVPTEIVFGF